MVDERWPYAAMAKALNRSEKATRDRCMRLRIALTKTGYSLNRVATIMGVDSHTPIWWLGNGWLKTQLVGSLRDRRGNRRRVIDPEDLLEFLENEDYWHVWVPERITDSAIREWAEELRAGVHFYTTAEAGDILCLTHYAVSQLIREGRIKAVKFQYNWRIRNDWLRYELQPWRKGKLLSEHELGFIRQWWGKKPATWIAEKLGNKRTDTAVGLAARRMGLKPLGRGYWKRLQAKTG